MEKGSSVFGIRTEVKNMNSFKSVEKALKYEFLRQKEAIEKGEKLTQETRRWDEQTQQTITMRSKEEANDYRYFPEGDLVTINIPEEYVGNIKNSLPELPHDKKERFVSEYGIPKYDAKVLTLSMDMADFFEEAAKKSKDVKAVSNWLMGDISRLMNENYMTVEKLKFTPGDLATLVNLISEGTISNAIGKKVVEVMFKDGGNPSDIVKANGWVLDNDEESIKASVEKILKDNPQSVEDYKNGKTRALGFIVGLVMKDTKGKANPKIVNKLVASMLND